ncbi:MAG: NUDIX hydrolase [Bacteroidales bacterium]|nr:NUDIX hydrolase [Bacteroidales bacterium]MBO7463528.1 NUDIX hydrolase [Bacteroidales bacterium]MBO7568317.1 NUDIX hydrolase [Bacteroidales bacterium]MBP5682568.1 NUDIX hydrolase [Bacteroidales bacterium]
MSTYSYKYPMPSVTTDTIVIRGEGITRQVLLIKRKRDPYKNCWAFPGGFTEEGETLEQSAARELEEETGVQCQFLSQFKAFGDPGRDPRGRTITIVFYAYVDEDTEAVANDDAADVDWFDLNNLPALAFDHAKILEEFILANH